MRAVPDTRCYRAWRSNRNWNDTDHKDDSQRYLLSMMLFDLLKSLFNKFSDSLIAIRGWSGLERVSDDGRLWLVQDWRGHAVWDHTTRKVLCRLADDVDEYYESAFSPDGRFIAALDEYGGVRVWNVQSGRLLRFAPVDHGWIEFSPDGETLIIKFDDPSEARKGEVVHQWKVEELERDSND